MTDVSNGLTGNGELEELAIGNAQLPVKQIPIDEVDTLADELVSEYSNPKFRVWYCGVIYEFGIAQVNDWRARAASGISPGGLFGYYVKQARAKKPPNGKSDHADDGNGVDTVYSVRGDETDGELRANMRTTLADAGLSPDLGEDTAEERTYEDLLKDVDEIFFGKDTEL